VKNDKENMEFYSGIPWVNVPPEQARAHPKGQLNWILWLIVVYFLGVAVFKFWWVLSLGGGLGLAVLNSIWPLLAGLGLAMRVPWSIMMAIVAAAFTAYALVRGLGDQAGLVRLFETLINVGIVFYLMDGERPNFIYRHRYRKYSVESGENDS